MNCGCSDMGVNTWMMLRSSFTARYSLPISNTLSFNKQGGRKYKLGINGFADLTNEEYKASRYSFAKPNNTISAPKVLLMSEADLPQSIGSVALLAIASFYPCKSASGGSIAKVSLSSKVRHELWMQRHGREYKDDAEKQLRRQIFAANLQHIEPFNKQGGRKYKLGINRFVDLTNEEYKASKYSFAKPNSTISAPKVLLMSEADLPDLPESIDWRDHGAVTPIKD